MSETVINIVMLGFIIAAVLVGVFSPLFALLAALWKWYLESSEASAVRQPKPAHANDAPGCN